jgi:hypothetical protein
MAKKISKLFVEAAKYIDMSVYGSITDGYGHTAGCGAICKVLGRNPAYIKAHQMNTGFSKVFKKRNGLSYWFGFPFDFSRVINKQRADHRVYAMLLMAELAKDQGL